jgi:DNA polymerase III sliding clamp (beta) subunit (PCNA family)
MLAELRFVQGAVAKKDFLPALTHFAIDNGRVRGYNGALALCSPLPCDIACNPRADALVAAIGRCDDAISLSLTPAGRLSIKSGKFRALVDCVSGDTPHVEPDGERQDFNGESLLVALKTLQPFIGDDASRPWSNGVLLRGSSAFATNNITIVEYWVGEPFPQEVNLPRACVKEMLRLGEPPIAIQLTENSVTFHYPGERWLRTQLLETSWPDLSKVLDLQSSPSPVVPELFPALETLKPFVDKLGSVYLNPGVVTTSTEEEEGATFEVPGLEAEARFNVDMLMLLSPVAKMVDWSAYPGPCLFYGDRLRGAIVGMRK